MECDVIFQLFGSVGIKISGIEVGFVGWVVGVCDESVEKLKFDSHQGRCTSRRQSGGKHHYRGGR